ncbi:hypothetical protein FO519_006320 [Halicephalobus sp. NKZ332]|nr:hypothetical protein FO519_006320 [Halicephalobus sp. NKZ332]
MASLPTDLQRIQQLQNPVEILENQVEVLKNQIEMLKLQNKLEKVCKMKLFENKYRFIILVLTTACLSMMLANVLILNFTMICMTEEKFHWENFTIDLGYDVFERVDFDPPKPPEETAEVPETPESKFPDFEIPGFKTPSPGFNWQTFNFAKTNPDLFLRIMKTIIKEASLRAAERAGEELDPRNIDFERFKNGFNLTDINPDIVVKLKEYLLEKIQTGQSTLEGIETGTQNLTDLGKVQVTDLELTNMTWNGEINGRIRILDRPADYYYSRTERVILFSAVAFGAILFLFPLTKLMNNKGTRKTFTIVGIISAISTGLIPLGASLGFVVFVILRIIQGIGFAACFPVIGSVTSNWAKLTENGIFNGALTGFLQLGPVIAMPVSGFFCHMGSWELSYYFHSLLTIIFIGAFWVIFRDTPGEHSKVSTRENSDIQEGKVIVDGRSRHNRTEFQVPLKEICKTKSVLAIWIAAIGNMGGIFLIMFTPAFIREVLKYPVIAVGFQAALPTLLQFIVKLKAGALSDLLKYEETFKVKLFNSIAFFGMAFFYILVSLVASENNQIISIIFLILSATVLGFNTGGFFKSATLVGRHFAYFINSIVQLIACLALLLDPVVIYIFSPDNSPSGWSCVFFFFALVLILTNIAFLFLGSGEPAPFTQNSKTDLQTNGEEKSMKPIIKSSQA